jgi:hypothetical protein
MAIFFVSENVSIGVNGSVDTSLSLRMKGLGSLKVSGPAASAMMCMLMRIPYRTSAILFCCRCPPTCTNHLQPLSCLEETCLSLIFVSPHRAARIFPQNAKINKPSHESNTRSQQLFGSQQSTGNRQ